MRAMYFPVNKGSVLGAVVWKFSLKPRICFFYLFVLGQFFVTTVQIEKARNK